MKEIIKQLASHDLLQEIIEGVPIRVFWKDRECRYLGCNTLFARDAGVAHPDALIGKSDFDMPWHEQAEAYRADDVAVMQSGESRLAFEEPQTTPDGSTIWLRTSKVPLFDDTRHVIGMVGVYEDISREKEQQAVLASSERELSNIFNSLQEAYYRTDIEGRIVKVSPSAGTLMACPAGELQGKMIAGYYVREDGRDLFLNALREGGGTVNHYEAEISRVDGEIIWVSTNAHYVRDECGDVTGIEGTIRDITAQKALEEQLRLTQFVSDHAPDMILWIDEQANIGYANAAACKALGYVQAELVAMTIPDVDPDFTAAAWPGHWQELQQKVHLCFETKKRRKDGSLFPVEVSANFVSFGNAEYNVAFIRDISRRKADEARLQESEARLRLALEAASQAWFDLDISSGSIIVSPEYARLIGYEPEAFHTSLQNWLDNIHPDDRDAVFTVFQRCLCTSGPETMEYRRRRKDGGWAWISSIGKVVERDGDGTPLRMIGIQTDISEQKQNLSLLEAERKRFVTLFNSSSDGMFIIDMHGNFIDINRTAYRRLGYSKQEMLAMKLNALDSPEFAARVPERLALIKTHGEATFDSAHYRKDGSVMPVEISASSIELDGEQVIFSVVRDVSERRQFEERLRQSQKMEAVGTLVGGIAHDFNNMLAAMQGNLYLARMQMQEHPVVVDRLTNIEQLGNRATEMVQQLLTFARKDSVSMRIFSLNAFMHEGYRLAGAAIPASIDHQTSVCSDELCIKGDVTQLQQVLMNLLNNAADAVAGVSEPIIRCSLMLFRADSAFRQRHPEVTGDGFACISVRDNGCGIPREQLDKIFEPFFTTKEVGKGTGLGLAMLYGAVQTHGGAVEVESEPGRGSVFKIYLPLSLEAPEPQQKQVSPGPAGRGETILLVDDDEDLRHTTREVLDTMGYHVLTACDGEEALALLRARRDQIDLIISDVIMPRLGGVQLLKLIRQSDATLPVILITGYDKNHVLGGEMQTSCCRVLNKPFDFDLLSRTVQALIKPG